MKCLFLHYLAPHNLTPTDPASITSMAYGKMFPLRPIQLFNLGLASDFNILPPSVFPLESEGWKNDCKV